MKTCIQRYLIIAVYLMFSASYAYPLESENSEIGWVGLYNNDMLSLLENEPHIELLCPKTLGQALQACRDAKLQPKTWTIDVLEKPEPNSQKLGTIAITATPGEGLTAAFLSANGPIDFTPDVFDTDWGYGPYFHQTFIERRKNWFLLPKNPLPKPGWINISQLTETPDVKDVVEGLVYVLDGKGIVITGIQKNKVSIRAEQPADMPCDGESPELKPAPQQTMLIPDLLDQDGHLKLTVKYMRGC